MPDDAYAAVTYDSEPDSVSAADASTVPLVYPSIVTRATAGRIVSDRVTAALPRPLIPEDRYVVRTTETAPVSVVTDDASITPVVLASSAFRSAAATVVSDSVTASLPRPLIPEDA